MNNKKQANKTEKSQDAADAGYSSAGIDKVKSLKTLPFIGFSLRCRSIVGKEKT